MARPRAKGDVGGKGLLAASEPGGEEVEDVLDGEAAAVDVGIGLAAEPDVEVEEDVGDEVIRGYLTCQTCSERYPIEDRIPNLLPPAMRQSK